MGATAGRDRRSTLGDKRGPTDAEAPPLSAMIRKQQRRRVPPRQSALHWQHFRSHFAMRIRLSQYHERTPRAQERAVGVQYARRVVAQDEHRSAAAHCRASGLARWEPSLPPIIQHGLLDEQLGSGNFAY